MGVGGACVPEFQCRKSLFGTVVKTWLFVITVFAPIGM